MLADSLGMHPDLYIFPEETRLLPHIIQQLDEFGDLNEAAARLALAKKLGTCKAYWHANDKRPVVLPAEVLQRSGFDGVVDALYAHFAAREGKRRWGDKTPMYLQHMNTLAHYLPDARFVHIYRDGRDAAQSFHRRWGYEPRRTIYRWKKALVDARDQGRELGAQRYFELRYEDVTADPEFWMRKVCAFLALEFHDNTLCSPMRYMEPGRAGERKIIRNSGKWARYFSIREVRALEAIAGALLRELGYGVISAAGDANPSAVQLALWKYKDRLSASRAHFKDYGIRSAGMFLRKACESLIQAGTNRY